MRLFKNRQNLVSIAMLALLLTLALPGTAFADKRDKWQDRDRDKRDRKCGKFVNCHDARDGRRDGRGPRRDWDDRSGRRHDRIHNRLDRRHDRFHDRVGDQDNRRHTRFHRGQRREHSRVHNPNNRGLDVREVNRTNTVPFRRPRG
ncbi:MAG: hypothetical protein H0U18_10425 [Pyrinomonadaceae bacterium]|nr:hypothetical protein [Pyrinomonadaceae bacterium]